jgi:cytochrome c peroxidase
MNHRLAISTVGLLVGVAAGTLLGACGGGAEEADHGAAANTPSFAPDDPRSAFVMLPPAPPAAVASSPELVALGRELYHERGLSANGDVSCATCHDLEKAGTDRLPVSLGTAKQEGERNAPTTLNAFLHSSQFWDGRAASVEEQAQGPVLNPIEHGLTAENIGSKLVELGYGERFEKLFGEKPNLEDFGAAVGAFERTLRTHSRFDAWMEGDAAALTAEEKDGAELFVKVGCVQCHSGRLLGGSSYRKLGQIHEWPTEDIGRAKVTGDDSDQYFFKVPSLLNVADTAPYLHDGSIESLEEMVEKMAWHQLNRKLTDTEVAKIVTFLKTTSGSLE